MRVYGIFIIGLYLLFGGIPNVYKKLVSAMYILNILFQSLFNLATPILLMLGLSWLLVEKCSAPRWLYAVLGVLGAIVGFVSMIKFIVSACESLERLEKERAERNKEAKGKNQSNENHTKTEL